MSFSVNSFLSKTEQLGSLAKKHKFSVSLTPPTGTNLPNGKIDFLCKKATLPARTFATTEHRMYGYGLNAEKNNIGVIIAAAGGSAHLPGMIAALTPIPVLGVPVESKKLRGLDSLLSIAQMPKGIPVGTVAIGDDGAINAALLAASIISLSDQKLKKNLNKWRIKQSSSVKKKPK